MEKSIKTTVVAADREYDESKSVIPTELARGIYVENPPSAEALKLMHLLMSKAGGRMADDTRHELRLAEIKKIEGMRNHTRSSLKTLFVELAGAVITFDNSEDQCEVIGGFLDRAKLDYRHEVSDDLLVAWWFGGAFREMAEKSCHWAILDRQTIFSLSSKYSILLFQYVSSLTNLRHVESKSFTISELRSVLGVSEGKLTRFADLRRFALEPSVAEISQLSRFIFSFSVKKVGRTIAEVEIHWTEKDIEQKRDAKKEIDRPKVGRKSRREGTVETVAQEKLSFPASGGLKYDEFWYPRAAAHTKRMAGGHMPDTKGLADAFRQWCEAKEIRLDAKNIEKTFIGFCKNYRPIL